jgi:DNA-binding NtrC family response regulator
MDKRHLIYLTRDPSADLTARFGEAGWDVETVQSTRSVPRLVRDRPVAGGLVDLSGFSSSDLDSIEACLALPNVGWVAIAAAGQLGDMRLRRLVRDYCFDYITLPARPERIVDAIGHACGMVSLEEPSAGDASPSGEGQMVGASEVMLALFRVIRKVATTDAPVFISGESGTGKELTAVAIHERSRRRSEPFVAINCGAIPPHLMQSELFGYERGAFTGATQRKIGRVESANGGTVFLDEIGDLPLESQASLLRFLQEGQVDRLGGHAPIDVDVRIISATHVDMETAVSEGRFRTDLYHRLCVLQVEEPPLRERGSDIELLALYMFERFRKEASQRLHGFTSDALVAMRNYAWPGNVRELGNRVRRAIVMAEGRRITARDLELTDHVEVVPVTLSQARESAERQAIELALLRHRGRLGEAAAELGVSRVTLYRLLSAHRMRPIEGGGDDTSSTQART